LKRKLRLGIVSFIVGSLMVFSPTNAFAESVMTTITCADTEGNQREFQVGWDNTHQYFSNPEITNIPAHYCEGGYAGIYIIYVTDGLEPDNPVRWYNGIAPLPTPSVEPEPVPSIEPTLDPEPTPIPEPTQSESPSPEPIIEPEPAPVVIVAEPTPSPSQESVVPVPEPEPTPTVEPDPSPTPIETPTPEIVPEETPEPQPTIAIAAPVSPVEEFLAQVDIELPTYLESVPGAVQLVAAAEAIMAIGSDMTPEEREESQGVVVAAVIVGQLAQVRRLK
jgi:hypothetical protein